MPKVPRKNISHKIADIKIEAEKVPEPKIPEILREEKPAEPVIVDTNPPKSGSVEKHLLPAPKFNPIWAWLAAAGILLAGLYVLWPARKEIPAATVPGNENTLTEEAGDWQKFTSLTSQLGSAFGSLSGMAGGTIGILQEISFLQNQGVSLFLSGRGDELLARLEKIKGYLGEIYDKGEFWQQAANSTGAENVPMRPGDVLALHVSVGQVRDFLDKLIPYLRDPAERRIIIFLENPSELRPGGGFLGSYGEMILANGALKEIFVHDINEPDRTLETKTVPPKQLQAIMTNWRAADTNWFFDFSDSARKTLEFMGKSGMYKDKTIEGAIGISAKVIEDLLGLTEPIQLSSSTPAIRPDNFLYQIQGEVQKGQAQQAPEPKKILENLTPVLLQRISELPENKKPQMAGLLFRWIEDGDMRIYLANPDFQRFAENMNMAGRTREVARDWNGVYLAFVSANVGGGKTDIFVEQEVKIETQISSEGWLNDHIVVSRKHTAQKTDPWWYRETNKSFFQIFTNPATNLSYADGGLDRKITPKINYLREKYAVDPEVEALEKTEKQLEDYPFIKSYTYRDKKTFSTWINTEAAGTSRFVVDLNRRAMAVPEAGMSYEFVLQKQSASEGEYFWQITAPVGFKFKENNMPVYEYKTAEPPGLWTIRLTLERI
ncbi:MAG: DUF4012 domain-containing protein [Candidatus Liptonbacteria bacterium]